MSNGVNEREEPAPELLPCPFCGGECRPNTTTYGEQTVREQEWPSATRHAVNCVACGASNSAIFCGFETPELAAAAWNRRAGVSGRSPAPALPAMYVVFSDDGEHIRWWSRSAPSWGEEAGFAAAGATVHALHSVPTEDELEELTLERDVLRDHLDAAVKSIDSAAWDALTAFAEHARSKPPFIEGQRASEIEAWRDEYCRLHPAWRSPAEVPPHWPEEVQEARRVLMNQLVQYRDSDDDSPLRDPYVAEKLDAAFAAVWRSAQQ